MADEQRRSTMGGLSEGIRTGLGILTAFKEAVEETLQDAVQRGDLTPERARQAMHAMAQRLQEGFEEAKGRVDFAASADVESLHAEVASLRERVERLEGGGAAPAGGDTSPGVILTD